MTLFLQPAFDDEQEGQAVRCTESHVMRHKVSTGRLMKRWSTTVHRLLRFRNLCGNKSSWKNPIADAVYQYLIPSSTCGHMVALLCEHIIHLATLKIHPSSSEETLAESQALVQHVEPQSDIVF